MNQQDSLTLSKLQIAEVQLERAPQLFLEENDYVSSTTLAGASEEILGKLLEREGQTHALGDFVNACVETGRIVFDKDWPKKTFVTMANHFRDNFKHFSGGETITLSSEAAVEIIDRAITNYFCLTGKESDRMREFMERAHGV